MLHTDETSTAESTPAQDQATVPTCLSHDEQLENLRRNHVWTAAALGLVPVPIVDVVGLIAVHLTLIKKLSNHYNVNFSENSGKSVVAALLGSVLPAALGGVAMSLFKALPIVGSSVSAVTLPAFFGATTHAMFKVFVKHFETGGTFLNLDVQKMKAHFKDQFKRAGSVVADDLKAAAPAQ